MEAAWNEYQNKKLQDKRRDEEARLILNQWSQARSRMEAEIQRKKEQINFATNFEQARGFVRTNWKSFGFNINADPTEDDSSEADYGSEAHSDEERDEVESIESPAIKNDDSDFNNSEDEQVMGAALISKDDVKKARRIIKQRKPQVIDIASVSEKKPTMLTTDEQLDMLAAIENYRVTMPETKFKNPKNHLPEIIASNVSVQQRFWDDHLKKKVPRMKFKYHQVGLVDGTSCTSASKDDKFSVENKLRFI